MSDIKAKSQVPPEEAKTILGLIFLWPLGVYLTLKYVPRWFSKTSFIVILVIYAFLTSWITASIIMAPSELAKGERQWKETVSTEEARNYHIDVSQSGGKEYLLASDKITIDCNLQESASSKSEKYKGELSSLQCDNRTISGTYSQYQSTEFNTEGFGVKQSAENGKFTLLFTLDKLDKGVWESDNLNLDTLQKDGINKTVVLQVKNKVLDSAVMAEKSIAIHYVFTDSDINLIKIRTDSHKEYVKAEQERKAKEAAEKKAKEEAAQLEKQRQQEEQEQRANTPPPVAPTPSKPSQPNPTPSPAPDTSNLPLKAICKDGSVSYQDTPSLPNYRGMCSGHGGIQTKLGRVP